MTSGEVNTSLLIFALGDQHLARLNTYTPFWDTEELENISLVDQLDHPYTGSSYRIVCGGKLTASHLDTCLRRRKYS